MQKDTEREKITLKMVAAHAGVSVSAVSMILNNYKQASFPQETKRRVYESCEALGYHRQPARERRSTQTKLIVAVVPSFENPYYAQILSACIRRAGEMGYRVMTLCTERNPDEEANLLSVCRTVDADGILCLYQPRYASMLQRLHREFPLFQLYDATADPCLNVISIDGFRVGSLIAEHLYHLNHRTIAYVTRPLSKRQSGSSRRLTGIRDYFTRKGFDALECIKSYSIESENLPFPQTIDSYETGRVLTEQILKKRIPFTAFVGTSDAIAYGIMDALLACGRRIPQDYSVCGCDNLPFSRHQAISLTTVEHFWSEKGHDAIDLLIREIENRAGGNGKRQSVNKIRMEYEPRLIARNSSGKCRPLSEKIKKSREVQ
ncbi:MAG: LacI family transcriptional regulator [Hungatella sp.]|nr:LacI family transcriptional regulator [Hungatella sp.]